MVCALLLSSSTALAGGIGGTVQYDGPGFGFTELGMTAGLTYKAGAGVFLGLGATANHNNELNQEQLVGSFTVGWGG